MVIVVVHVILVVVVEARLLVGPGRALKNLKKFCRSETLFEKNSW